jgi:predicted small lipoprotein YifL
MTTANGRNIMRITALVAATALTLTLTACGQDEPMDDAMTDKPSMTDDKMGDDMAKDDAMTDKMGDRREGTFAGLNGKSVAGTVTIADGKVELTGFSSDEGPDLHVYLANGSDSAAVTAGKSLGEVTPDDATQTFELDGVDPADYDTVVIHCDKARAVFGAAKLS